MTCAACDQQLLHCHELSIEHADGSTECTEVGCAVPHAQHRFVASCDELLGPCPCAVPAVPYAGAA